MNYFFLEKRLKERAASRSLRKLTLTEGLIDFCSNDYLGIASNNLLQSQHQLASSGSKGSRLLAGNFELIEQAENQLAAFYKQPAALIFNSGYDANIGLLSCVPQKGDTILYDYLCHASIRDGIRLSFATSYNFEHNNLESLEQKLKLSQGNVFVVTESVFSMDGDEAPLQDLVNLCNEYNANLIVDEAHATGIFGANGEGFCVQESLHNDVFARIHTFGKACGTHGACVVGSKSLKEYLINFARSFIYTTALPPMAIQSIIEAHQILPTLVEERNQLKNLIEYFNASNIKHQKIASKTAIQAVIIQGNEAVKHAAHQLQKNGFDVRPILYPTVPKNTERLRIVLHSFNTIQQLENLIEILNEL